MRSEYGVSGVCLMYPAQLVFLAHTLVSTLDVRTLRVNKSAVCDNVPTLRLFVIGLAVNTRTHLHINTHFTCTYVNELLLRRRNNNPTPWV